MQIEIDDLKIFMYNPDNEFTELMQTFFHLKFSCTIQEMKYCIS